MSKRKLFLLSFVISFFSIAILCYLTKQPLILLPVDYSVQAFIPYGFLIIFLCFCLVYINLPFVRFLSFLFNKQNNNAFYLITTLLILQIATIIIGYLESSFTINGAELFYYYKSVGNSFIYIVVGNLAAVFVSTLYVKGLVLKKQEEEISFDFDNK